MSNHALGIFAVFGIPPTTNQATGKDALAARGFVQTFGTSSYGVRVRNAINRTGLSEFIVLNSGAATSNAIFSPVGVELDNVDTVVCGASMSANPDPGTGDGGLMISTSTGLLLYVSRSQGGDVLVNGTLLSPAQITIPARDAESVIEVEYTPSAIRIYANNQLVYTASGTFPTARFRGIYSSRSNLGNNLNWNWISYLYWGGSSRLGMMDVQVGTLQTPSVDTGTRTGAGSTVAALSSIDGDTSYMTYTAETGQQTVMPIALSLPTDATVHAVNIRSSAVGAGGGDASGKIKVVTPDGTSDVGNLTIAVGYSATNLTVAVDPATSTSFDAADLAAGDLEVGVQETG